MLIELDGKTPKIGKDVFIAPTAVLIGDVEIGDGSSVWFGAVLRADFGSIRIGEGTTIQDNAVIHSHETEPTIIGNNVTVGHNVTAEGCRVGDWSLLGINSVILPFVELGERVVVAAGSVVLENTKVPDKKLVVGVPAKIKGDLQGRALEWTEFAPRDYQKMQARYRAQGIDKIEITNKT